MLTRWYLLVLLICCPVLICRGEEIVVESVLISVIHSAEVPARDAGVLTELNVQEGDQVRRDDLLVKLDVEEAELQLRQARLQLEMAQREFKNNLRNLFALKASEVASAELKRAEEANRKYRETISQTEMDRLKLISEKAVLDYQLAEHEHDLLGMTADLKQLEVEQAEHLVRRRLITSPIDGTVVRLDHRLGEWVQPGMTILKVIDTHRLRAEAVLPGKYRHLSFQQAQVRVAVPGLTGDQMRYVEGKISFVHPEIDPVDGSFRVWAELNNDELQLRPGDSVTMDIVLPEDSPSPATTSSP